MITLPERDRDESMSTLAYGGVLSGEEKRRENTMKGSVIEQEKNPLPMTASDL